MRTVALIVCCQSLFEIACELDVGLVRITLAPENVSVRHAQMPFPAFPAFDPPLLRSALRNYAGHASLKGNRRSFKPCFAVRTWPRLRFATPGWLATRSPQGEAWRRRELNSEEKCATLHVHLQTLIILHPGFLLGRTSTNQDAKILS